MEPCAGRDSVIAAAALGDDGSSRGRTASRGANTYIKCDISMKIETSVNCAHEK